MKGLYVIVLALVLGSLVSFVIDKSRGDNQAETLYKLVNEYRAENGVKTLKWDTHLESASKKRVAFFAELVDNSEKFSNFHLVPVAFTAFTSEVGFETNLAGENLAVGDFRDPKNVLDAWKRSETHNKNMLSDEWTHTAVARLQGRTFVSDSYGEIENAEYYVQFFIRK